MLNEVIDKLDLDMTYTELYKMVDVADVDATQIMQITVTDTDAERAGEIAQTIADIVPDVLVEKVEAGSCKAVSDVIIDPNKVFPRPRSTLCWPVCWALFWCAAFWCWHICCTIPLWTMKMFRRNSACPCWA